MTLASVAGILIVPVTFAVVEYLSHRFTSGGKDLTMDSPHVPGADAEIKPEVQGGGA
jgi:HAE1 family hydrophobic/amphiphilic exporter-1